jgi:hypothetical protein
MAPKTASRQESDPITVLTMRSPGSFGPALLGLILLLSGKRADDDTSHSTSAWVQRWVGGWRSPP